MQISRSPGGYHKPADVWDIQPIAGFHHLVLSAYQPVLVQFSIPLNPL